MTAGIWGAQHVERYGQRGADPLRVCAAWHANRPKSALSSLAQLGPQPLLGFVRKRRLENTWPEGFDLGKHHVFGYNFKEDKKRRRSFGDRLTEFPDEIIADAIVCYAFLAFHADLALRP